MGLRGWVMAVAVVVVAAQGGAARAGTSLNEVGALLVYPVIMALEGEASQIETFVTLTNAGPNPVLAHFYYINGDSSPWRTDYCAECNFQIQLTGNDTETLTIRQFGDGIAVSSEDSAFSVSCPFPFGMIIVTQEDGTLYPWNTYTDNVLLGEQVVVDYRAGTAFSLPAVPFQGGTANDDFRNYSFDDKEFAKLPRVVAADFLAPTVAGGTRALLALFTPGFERRYPPLVDCSVTGFDAAENAFSASIQFGCWALADLCDVSPEFCWPNLGLGTAQDTHGWVQLNCRVDEDPHLANGFDADGGVHGALIQYQEGGAALPAGSGTPFAGNAAWGRLLYQSVTAGDALTLHMQAHPFL